MNLKKKMLGHANRVRGNRPGKDATNRCNEILYCTSEHSSKGCTSERNLHADPEILENGWKRCFSENGWKDVPFYLPVQTDQFVRFKRRVCATLRSKDQSDFVDSRVPQVKAFKDGIYMIFIGVNDICLSLFQHKLSPAKVKNKTVPSVVAAISKAIHDLRKEGAMNFLIIDIMALGCTPYVLARASKGPYNSTDQWGCLEDYNDIAYLFHMEGVGSSIAISFSVYETLRSSWQIRRGSCKYGEGAKQKADDAYTSAKDTMSGKAETHYESPKITMLYTMQLSQIKDSEYDRFILVVS
ncbi:hypothetical protein GIB67_026511 [Kingdonia uniflora]|uniref:GDSL esterase/lipase n=1 Tax=Kingdonia uniflora TaxID=39325 RepID=A0A7J7PCF6_9MAGN|nr:hypothetical protein GIB67_026511 [Kingdonia uniflora]